MEPIKFYKVLHCGKNNAEMDYKMGTDDTTTLTEDSLDTEKGLGVGNGNNINFMSNLIQISRSALAMHIRCYGSQINFYKEII